MQILFGNAVMQILCLVVEILLSVMEIPKMLAFKLNDDKLSLKAKFWESPRGGLSGSLGIYTYE